MVSLFTQGGKEPLKCIGYRMNFVVPKKLCFTLFDCDNAWKSSQLSNISI
jgi:hypothetical protein